MKFSDIQIGTCIKNKNETAIKINSNHIINSSGEIKKINKNKKVVENEKEN